MQTQTTRRSVLLGLAAASTAAATSLEANASTVSENPEIIRLGEQLPETLNSYVTVTKDKRQKLRAAEAIWPKAPEEILLFCEGAIPEKRVCGRALEREIPLRWPEARNYHYLTVEGAKKQIALQEHEVSRILKTKSKRGLAAAEAYLATLKAKLPMSQKYCAEIEHIQSTCGYEEAVKASGLARDELRDLITSLMRLEPKSMEGVVIQAEALKAWGEVERFYRTFEPAAAAWPVQFAENLLRLTSSSSRTAT